MLHLLLYPCRPEKAFTLTRHCIKNVSERVNVLSSHQSISTARDLQVIGSSNKPYSRKPTSVGFALSLPPYFETW